MKIRKSNILFLLGGACLAASLALYILNSKTAQKSGEYAKTILSRMNEITNNDNNSDEKILAWKEPKESFQESVEVLGDEYFAVLEIPEIGISLPVCKDYSYNQMSKSLCLFSGSLSKNNAVICGHNYSSFLKDLDKVYEGDSIYLTNIFGTVFEYTVVETELIGGYEMDSLLGEEDWDLTVFTCNYSGRSRYVVRCKTAV